MYEVWIKDLRFGQDWISAEEAERMAQEWTVEGTKGNKTNYVKVSPNRKRVYLKKT